MPSVDYLMIAIGIGAVLLVFWWLNAGVQRQLPDEERIQWQFDTFQWFLRHLTRHRSFDETTLVRPVPEDFPVQAQGHELAEELFELTREYAGMEDWPCQLQAHGRDPDDTFANSLVRPVEQQGAAGTFQADETGEITITYSADGIDRPMSLVAVFAHELAHYLIGTVDELPPGGVDAEELATDLCAVFMGFGIFQANSAFEFSRNDDAVYSESMARFTGYLTELELAYGLAIFVMAKGLKPRTVKKYLDGNPRRYFRDAVADIKNNRQDQLQRLRQLL